MNVTAIIPNTSDLATPCRPGDHRWVSTNDHQADRSTWTCQRCGEVKVKITDQSLFYVWVRHR